MSMLYNWARTRLKQRQKVISFANTIFFLLTFVYGGIFFCLCLANVGDERIALLHDIGLRLIINTLVFFMYNLVLFFLPRFLFYSCDLLFFGITQLKSKVIMLFIGFIGKASYFPLFFLPIFLSVIYIFNEDSLLFLAPFMFLIMLVIMIIFILQYKNNSVSRGFISADNK